MIHPLIRNRLRKNLPRQSPKYLLTKAFSVIRTLNRAINDLDLHRLEQRLRWKNFPSQIYHVELAANIPKNRLHQPRQPLKRKHHQVKFFKNFVKLQTKNYFLENPVKSNLLMTIFFSQIKIQLSIIFQQLPKPNHQNHRPHQVLPVLNQIQKTQINNLQ